MVIKKIEGDRLILVSYKHNGNILFSAFFKNELEKRADVALLIINHFKELGHEISIEFSEKRYTPFIIKKSGVIYELEYSCVPYYVVDS